MTHDFLRKHRPWEEIVPPEFFLPRTYRPSHAAKLPLFANIQQDSHNIQQDTQMKQAHRNAIAGYSRFTKNCHVLQEQGVFIVYIKTSLLEGFAESGIEILDEVICPVWGQGGSAAGSTPYHEAYRRRSTTDRDEALTVAAFLNNGQDETTASSYKFTQLV